MINEFLLKFIIVLICFLICLLNSINYEINTKDAVLQYRDDIKNPVFKRAFLDTLPFMVHGCTILTFMLFLITIYNFYTLNICNFAKL